MVQEDLGAGGDGPRAVPRWHPRIRPRDRAEDSPVRVPSQRGAFAKGDLAEELGRNKKTVDRLIARLRSEGLLVSEPVWDEHGGQRANVYRIASGEGLLVAQVLE